MRSGSLRSGVMSRVEQMRTGLHRATHGHGVLFVILLFCTVTGRSVADISPNSNVSVKDIIDHLLEKSNYDDTIRPSSDNGEAVRVEVDVVLNTLGPVIEREMQMTASFYLRQQWRDPRLAFRSLSTHRNQTLLLSQRRAGALWLPDIYFSQSKDEARHDITVPNLMIRLSPDGTVLYSQRLTVTFQCLMDLRNFPLDQQVCYIRMESYSHTTEDMFFAWSSQRKSMDILENAHIPDFELSKITTHDCTATYATGTFPCLEARLHLQRQIGFYMIQTYIPCMLIVSLSWLSFWLDAHAIPARISVGLLTVLTITTQSTSVRSELPRVPYTKSIDVWISVCLIFVFAAYMQYAFVTVFSRRHRKSLGQFPSSATKKKDKENENREVPVNPNWTSTTSSDGKQCNGRVPDSQPASGHISNDQPPNARSSLGQLSNDGTPDGRLTSNHAPEGKQPNGHAPSGKPTNRYASFSDAPVRTQSVSTSTYCRRSASFQQESEARDMGHMVDKWSRVMFPFCFLLFNIGYWVYYTHSANKPE